MAAREMGQLSLIHALSLVVLYARAGSPKFEPAAVRWLARLALERHEVRLNISDSPRVSGRASAEHQKMPSPANPKAHRT
jgi:hypothetical protein